MSGRRTWRCRIGLHSWAVWEVDTFASISAGVATDRCTDCRTERRRIVR